MSPQWSNREPTCFEIRIVGRLSLQCAAWFEDMVILIDEDHSPVQTVIRGPIRDTAALYSLISRARDLGLLLVSVRPVDSGAACQDVAERDS